jgi:phosphoglycolate phosphatase-like HAD superfamily hydrolase
MSTLILDLDGTLLDVRARHYAVYAGLLEQMGGRPLAEPAYWRCRRAGLAAGDLLRDLPPAGRDEFRRGWLDRIEKPEALALDRLYRGAVPTLESLAKEHQLVLITLRHDARTLHCQLKSVGLTEYFEAVISPPEPGVSRKADLWAREGDAEVRVVGDSETDIELANDLGAECVCVTHGLRSARFLRERGARCLVSSLPALLTCTSVAAERSQG